MERDGHISGSFFIIETKPYFLASQRRGLENNYFITNRLFTKNVQKKFLSHKQVLRKNNVPIQQLTFTTNTAWIASSPRNSFITRIARSSEAWSVYSYEFHISYQVIKLNRNSGCSMLAHIQHITKRLYIFKYFSEHYLSTIVNCLPCIEAIHKSIWFS